jgi:hypothetical protein
VLNLADAKTKYTNSEKIEAHVSGTEAGHSVAVSDDYVFFTSGNKIYAYDIDDEEVSTKNKEL